MKKRITALLLACAMGFSLAACGSGTSSADPQQAGAEAAGSAAAAGEDIKTTLTVGITQDPGTMYPYYMLSSVGRSLYTPVYEGLFMYDENTRPEPVLVDSYEIDEDMLGITLHLKQGVLFHDGSEMKAKDVLFSIDCLLNSSWASNIGDIDRENCTAIDDSTVYLHYNTVQGPLLYQLCNVYVLSEDYMKNVGEDNYTFNCIGTGPYKWGDYAAGTEYHLEKFDGYREEKALDEITVRVIPESSVQAVELATGGIDLALGLSYRDIAGYEEDSASEYTVTRGPAIGSFVMTAALTNEIMQNDNVRLAFAYAINYEAINSVVYSGLATPSKNIYAYGIPAWKEAETIHTYDPERAKQLLAEAGYADGVTIDLYTLNTTAAIETSEILVSNCADVGITLNVISGDTASINTYRAQGVPGFTLQTLYTNGDPYIMLKTFGTPFYSQVQNLASNPNYEPACQILVEAMSTIEESERNALYQQIMETSYSNCFTVPLMDLSDNAVHSKKLEGFWMGGPAYHYEDCRWTA